MNQNSMIKFILCGDSNVGKTSIALRFTKDAFNENINATIGVDILVKRVDYQGSTYKISITDTSGQEKYQALSNLYFRGARVILFTYAINSRESFNNVTRWIQSSRKNCDNPDFIGVLIGNKIDLEDQRVVSYEEGEQLAQSNEFLFLECSAKTSAGIDDVFEDAFNSVMVQQEEREAKQQQYMLQQQMVGDIYNTNTTDANAGSNKVDLNAPSDQSSGNGYGCC